MIEDFNAAFIRRLGTSLAGAAVANYGGGTNAGPVGVEFEAGSAEIELKYSACPTPAL